MKKIPSFTIDHIHLLRGIYVSRKDYLGDHVVTTFDIRMKEPNREPAIGYGALHTIEHLAATFLRNHPVWGDKIVFWGPMGCCTGNYFLMQGDLESKDIVELMRRHSDLSATSTAKCREPLHATAEIICCTTCLWLDGRQTNICARFSMLSKKRTWFILL